MNIEKTIQIAAAAIIEDDAGRVLLMKRGKCARNQIGRWEFPGGRVKFGETLENAVRREVKEELGVQVSVRRILALFEDILLNEGQHWISPAYICSISSGIPSIMEKDKAELIGWFETDTLPGELTEVATKTLEEYLRQKKNVS
jgi:mutator protein MutT